MDTTVQLPRYNAPGLADRLDRDLLRRWNETIADIYQRKSQELLYRRPVSGRENATLATPFFVLGPSAQLEGEVAITARWPADPLGAVNCVGQPLAKELNDHGSMGRRLHDDYCEYLVVRGRDRRGRDRPKRVQVTTELREYWLCIARYDPPAVRRMAAGILGFRPTWKQLYGGDPERLDEEERTLGFARMVAGNGEDTRLEDAGVPEVPVGPLNTEHLLFLRHPANGLDDLAEILLLGAHPYAAGRPRRPQAADPEVIFSALGAPEFSCRRPDPVSWPKARTPPSTGRPWSRPTPWASRSSASAPARSATGAPRSRSGGSAGAGATPASGSAWRSGRTTTRTCSSTTSRTGPTSSR